MYLLGIILTRAFLVHGQTCSTFSIPQNRLNTALTKNVVKVFLSSRDLSTCANSCMYNTICYGVNYSVKDKVCEWLFSFNDSSRMVRGFKGYVHLDMMVDWKLVNLTRKPFSVRGIVTKGNPEIEGVVTSFKISTSPNCSEHSYTYVTNGTDVTDSEKCKEEQRKWVFCDEYNYMQHLCKREDMFELVPVNEPEDREIEGKYMKNKFQKHDIVVVQIEAPRYTGNTNKMFLWLNDRTNVTVKKTWAQEAHHRAGDREQTLLGTMAITWLTTKFSVNSTN